MSQTANKKVKRSVNGVLLLDKPTGITSNRALQLVKRLFYAKKAGHTGSLDPLASGMLPICFGEATKFSQYLLDADKSYYVKAKLGIRTATADEEGDVIAKRDVPSLTQAQIDSAFDAFRGEIEQVPSMFSAVKHKGQPLYKLARQGIEIERKSRQIKIYELNVLDYSNNIVTFEVRCSKGTYVRTLVDDFGESLGCGAHVIQLRRLTVGHFHMDQMISMETLEKTDEQTLMNYLLPLESTVANWPAIELERHTAFYLKQGQAVMVPKAPTQGWLRLLQKDGRFIGVGEILCDGKVAPRRLITDL